MNKPNSKSLHFYSNKENKVVNSRQHNYLNTKNLSNNKI